MSGWLYIVGPLLVAVTVTLVAIPRLAAFAPQLRRTHAPLWLLLAQVTLAPLSWAVIWAAPDERGFEATETCPDIDPGSAIATTLIVLFFGSGMVGGLAVAAAYVTNRANLARPALFALVALLAPFGIVIGAVYDALCGIN